MSYGKKVQRGIEQVKKNLQHRQGQADYAFAKEFEIALEKEIGLRCYVTTDARSTNERPRLNITARTDKKREIKNPDLAGSNRVNYFYA